MTNPAGHGTGQPDAGLPEPAAGPPARLLTTEFVQSWFLRARPGDRFDSDPSRRSAAWANWAVSHLTEVATGDRRYPALRLDGKFYDPQGSGRSSSLSRQMRPHLEIPRHVIGRSDDEFPDRLAHAGNALAFPWWMYSEVVAARRALFNHPHGPVRDLVDALNARRPALRDTLAATTRAVAGRWSVVEKLLVASPDGLLDEATGPFDTDEIAAFFPPATDLGLHAVYDERLAERNGQWASRRVGVWQLRGVTDGGDRFALGVLTPRLTANSILHDPTFDVAAEAPAALLVRALLLRRIARTHLHGVSVEHLSVADPEPERTGKQPHLQARAAQVGKALPEASIEAAVHFLQVHPDPDVAWRQLRSWSGDEYVLVTTQASFVAAHRNAARYVRRAEEPPRDDINQLLPLAWAKSGKPVRVTFSLPRPDDD